MHANIGKAVFILARSEGKGEIPPELEWPIQRQQIIQATGWTFDYVDSLDIEQIGEVLGYYDGLEKARTWQK